LAKRLHFHGICTNGSSFFNFGFGKKPLHHLAIRLSSKESDGAIRRISAASLPSGLALLEMFTRHGKLGFVEFYIKKCMIFEVMY
jgi:hypothetical protein